MAHKIFLFDSPLREVDTLLNYSRTGTTGYIAGDALFVLSQCHPEYEYAALVRSQEKADRVKKAYPSLRIVLGDLDDYDTLNEESARADIVLRV